ncbi:MAG: hypothetical protein IPM58_05700 [Nitrospira sp.]|nr:hypothetical protein [Nitrospira sp.]
MGQGARIDSDNNTAQVADPIDIQVGGLLRLTGKSEIETTAIGRAPAADLIVKATDIQLLGGSKFSVDTTSSSSGAGGGVIIQGNVGLSNLVTIDGLESGIFTSTQGTGPAGNIAVKATSVTIQNGGKISADTTGTSSTATGGAIIINATDHVTLTSGASITASSVVDPEVPGTGIADAGNVFVNAGQQLDLTTDSSITTTTESAQANGGNIDIRAVDHVRLVNSEISTSVIGAEGSGGNIFIDPNLVLLQDSTVTARAVTGSGGNITFVTPLFLADPDSIVSASSEFGPDGKVTARSNLIATIPQLESKSDSATSAPPKPLRRTGRWRAKHLYPCRTRCPPHPTWRMAQQPSRNGTLDRR